MSARGQGFAKLTTVTQARNILNKLTISQNQEEIRTASSINRVLATDIIATKDLPGFPRSAMDGYAVLAEDTIGASDHNPVEIPVIGTSEIGDTEAMALRKGSAIRISTGAPLPDHANAVIKLEDTEFHDNKIELFLAVPPGKNVAQPDEDVSSGSLVLSKGRKVTPWDIGMLEALGYNTIQVYQKPTIGTVSTGNELVPSGSEPIKGQVVDSNRPAINAWLTLLGANVTHTLHVKDELEVIASTLDDLIGEVDLIVTTGGTSVGSKDFIPEIIEGKGDLLVHGVTIRPGKPVAIGILKKGKTQSIIIGLPGYPLAAFLNFYIFVSPFVCRYTGYPPLWDKRRTIRLEQQIASKAGTRDFVRLKHTPEGGRVIRVTGAGILSSLTSADYLLEIPEDIEGYAADTEVEVILLRDDYEPENI